VNAPVAIRIILLGLGLLSALAHWFMPRLTRPDLYFSITVAPDFRDSAAGRLVLRGYRSGVIGVSVVALSLLAALAFTAALPFAPLALLLQLGAYFGVFYRARRFVLPHSVTPTTVREAQVGRRAGVPGGWLLASGPFALLIACAAYLWAHWHQLPARLIVHWGADGQADRWVSRSLGTVFFPMLVATAILLTLTLILYGMAHWLRPIYAGGLQGEHEARFRRAASVLLVALEYWIAIEFAWLALRPLLPVFLQRPPPAIAMVPGLLIVLATAVLMWLGQGGSRMPSAGRSSSAATRPIGDRTEDCLWRLGVFYFNRDDPSVLVERRFGIGYTVNFARPMAWVIVLLPLLALALAAATIAARHMGR
jgi:uncharacterized membrane protein